MCQLVKNNSISGSKMASCKIVYTTHANLKKELVGMDVGTVGFKNQKLCRFRKCNKNRDIIKRLEKSKLLANWDYDAEQKKWVDAERIRQKAVNKEKFFDALAESEKSDEVRMRERMAALGDGGSGLDAALDQLSGINFAAITTTTTSTTTSTSTSTAAAPKTKKWKWEEEEENRRALSSTDSFLVERGYSVASTSTSKTKIEAIRTLFFAKLANKEVCAAPSNSSTLASAREEELDVLKAIYGDELFENGHNFALPIESYEPSETLSGTSPPQLTVEFWNENSLYPFEPPVLSLVGGGLSEELLAEVTTITRKWVDEEWHERVGEPLVFELVEVVREAVECVVEKFENAEKFRVQEGETLRRKELAERPPPPPSNHKSEAERRIDAKARLGEFGNSNQAVEKEGRENNTKHTNKSKNKGSSGPSNLDLINDLFS